MIKYITIALFLLTVASTSPAQSPRADTAMLMSVYNTGVVFKLTPADFGGTVTTSLVATMVMSYDTIMVLKDSGKKDTVSRKTILRYKAERRCDKMSNGLKDKVVVMELNKDCDVTQTCLNVQRAGAKAFVIIHNSNSQGNIKLPKQGLYKDSIRIPVFTVRSGVGDSITTLLPTVVGIIKPTATVVQPLRALDSTTVSASRDKATEKSVQITEENAENATFEDLNGNSTIGKKAFTLSPNPSRNETSLTYQFPQATDVTVEVKTTSGQVVLSKILRGVTIGTLEIQTTNWANGTYFLALQYDKVVKTKKFVVQH
jgi:PA domain/Secretion system C-terminal sorting domain